MVLHEGSASVMAQSNITTENGSSDQDTRERAAGRPVEDKRPSRRYPSNRVLHERERTVQSMREIEFPIAMRGYERAAVDRYVTEVNRVIAELEISSSPESAVRHALDEVSEETRDLLQRAYETAEEIAAKSRSKADDRLQQAERDGQELRAVAAREAEQTREIAMRETQELREATAREVHEMRETTHRELADLRETTSHEISELREVAAREAQQLRASAQREADELREIARRETDELRERVEAHAGALARSAEKVWRERRRLLEDMRAVADQLTAIGETEASRFAQFEPEGLASGRIEEPAES
jgi:cell division septum initiation protein DivIVA